MPGISKPSMSEKDASLHSRAPSPKKDQARPGHSHTLCQHVCIGQGDMSHEMLLQGYAAGSAGRSGMQGASGKVCMQSKLRVHRPLPYLPMCGQASKWNGHACPGHADAHAGHKICGMRQPCRHGAQQIAEKRLRCTIVAQELTGLAWPGLASLDSYTLQPKKQPATSPWKQGSPVFCERRPDRVTV